jgi:hypothetical protein
MHLRALGHLVLFCLVALGAGSCAVSPPPPSATASPLPTPSGATEDERAIVLGIVAMARHGDLAELAEMHLADGGVWLGLGESLMVRRSRDELADRGAWRLDGDGFRGRAGPFSALELIAGTEVFPDGPEIGLMNLSVGPHPRCASPPAKPPDGLDDPRQLSLQPIEMRSCLDWWSVDLFIGPDGELVAVTLDLFEP